MFFRTAVFVLLVVGACAEQGASPLDAPAGTWMPLPPPPVLPTPEAPIPDEEPYTWADFCSAEELYMQRVRGPFVVPLGTPPTYDDPANPLTYDPGHFQKDPAQSPTALTPDWANMVQQEMCNLVEALGGTLDGEDDTQLATMFVQGTFTPVLVASPTPAFTYGTRTGFYQRLGPLVFMRFAITWTNDDDTLNLTEAEVLPPFAPASGIEAEGQVNLTDSAFGTASASFTTAQLLLKDTFGGIRARGRQTTMASSTALLTYGDSNLRTLKGSLWCRTSGAFNY